MGKIFGAVTFVFVIFFYILDIIHQILQSTINEFLNKLLKETTEETINHQKAEWGFFNTASYLTYCKTTRVSFTFYE
jgi:hypothetical protein